MQIQALILTASQTNKGNFMRCLRCGAQMLLQRTEKRGKENIEVWQCPSCAKISLEPSQSKWVKFDEKPQF